MQDQDIASLLQKAVLKACKNKTPLQIIGGNSKSFYGREVGGVAINVVDHQGLINYQPSELVITARCGTPLAEIEKILGQQGQMLPFDPPHFGVSATLGGMVASGLSGPRRAFTGSVRDFVLGCKVINGKGEILSFGGEVMKNVAGYDVSRLLAGSMGTLGIILEVSLKVLPLPAYEMTCCFTCIESQAVKMMVDMAQKCLPLSGLAYYDQVMYLRLSGSEQSVQDAAGRIGADGLKEDNRFWRQLREQEFAFFQQQGDLWRISVAPSTGKIDLKGDWLYDWGGALRWLKTEEPASRVFAATFQAEGHAQLFRGQNRKGEVFQPLTDKLQQLNHGLKKSFDPSGIFNPYRLNRDW